MIGYIDKASDNDLGLLDGDAYGSYVRKINKRFTSIFVDKLNTMFMASKQGDEDYFAVQDLSQRLYTLTCGVCLGVEGDPRREFDLISRAVKLAAPSNNGAVNKEALESDYFSHAGNYLVSHQWGIKGDEKCNDGRVRYITDCILHRVPIRSLNGNSLPELDNHGIGYFLAPLPVPLSTSHH